VKTRAPRLATNQQLYRSLLVLRQDAIARGFLGPGTRVYGNSLIRLGTELLAAGVTFDQLPRLTAKGPHET
jgi:hypothetical protein